MPGPLLQDPSHVVYNGSQQCQTKSMRQSSHNFHSINDNMCLLLDQLQPVLETILTWQKKASKQLVTYYNMHIYIYIIRFGQIKLVIPRNLLLKFSFLAMRASSHVNVC